MESTSAPWHCVGWIRNGSGTGRGGGDPRLVNRAGVQAERGGVQTGGRVTQVRFFNPQEGGAVFALLALAVAAALVAHEQQGDEEDSEDGERVEEDEVEEGLVGAHHRLHGGRCGERTDVDNETRRVTSCGQASRRWRCEACLFDVCLERPKKESTGMHLYYSTSNRPPSLDCMRSHSLCGCAFVMWRSQLGRAICIRVYINVPLWDVSAPVQENLLGIVLSHCKINWLNFTLDFMTLQACIMQFVTAINDLHLGVDTGE